MTRDHDDAAAIYVLAERADLVSFDLFDTLIVRNVLDPADVFSMVGKRVGLTLDFRDLRHAAHLYARDKHRPAIANHEVTLPEIYQELEKYDLPALCGQPLDAVMALELATEDELIGSNPFMLGVFERLVAAGKRVVITTDTYFERAFLEPLLVRCGYVGHQELIISSEIRRAKHDGSVWPWLTSHTGLAAARILHIGDNPGADVARPRRAGLKCFHYRSALSLALADPDYRQVHDLFSAEERREESVSRWLAAIAHRFFVARPAGPSNGFHWFGFVTIGIVLVLFTHWLHRSAKRDGGERLLFLARDGYLLQQLYTALYPAGAGGIPSVYTYASRRAFRIPAIARLDAATLRTLTDFSHIQPVRRHLERLGLEPAAHLAAVQRAGFAGLDTPVAYRDKPRLADLLRDLEAEVVAVATRERALLKRYLHDIDALDAKHVGLIDVGWNGSLQRAYLDLVRDFWGSDQRVSGYYIGLREPSVVFDKIGRLGGMRGFLSDLGLPLSNRDLVYDGATLIEFALYAPHGTTLGFAEVSGGVEPVLDATEVAFNIDASRQIHRGVHELVAALAGIDLAGDIVIEPFLRPLTRLVHQPTLAEARLLGRFQLSTEVGEYHHLSPMAQPRLANPLALWREFRQSTWPQAYLKQVPMGHKLDRSVKAVRPAIGLLRRAAGKIIRRFRPRR